MREVGREGEKGRETQREEGGREREGERGKDRGVWCSRLTNMLRVMCCTVAHQEKSNRAVEELQLGLELLWQSHNTRAVYWTCPYCLSSSMPGRHIRFFTGKDFRVHVRGYHEDVARRPLGNVLHCFKCGKEVLPSPSNLHIELPVENRWRNSLGIIEEVLPLFDVHEHHHTVRLLF